MPGPLLTAQGVTKLYGGVAALTDVSFTVAADEVLALIGPNGAGKTTMFDVMTGMVPASRGSIEFRGRDVTRRKSFEIAQLGMARTFQNLRIFRSMSVLENVMAGATGRFSRRGVLANSVRISALRTSRLRGVAESMLEMVGLASKAATRADHLSYPDQRRLEIARALATSPVLLVLDEPVAGMNESEAAEIGELVSRIRRGSTAVVLIEHNMRFVMSWSDRVVVLDKGRQIAAGTPAEIYRDPAVIEAYIGVQT